MAEGVKRSRAHTAEAEGEHDVATKDALQRQMDEARDSISQTVTNIKDTVVDQYNSVKESVSDTLDWREQFRSHPVVWCFGALSVGYVLGNSVHNAFKDTKHEDGLLSHLSALGDYFADELSKQGMNILTPALTGTVLVPVLASKISEMTGIDLSDLTAQLIAQGNGNSKSRTKSKKKKSSTKKKGKKKKSGKNL